VKVQPTFGWDCGCTRHSNLAIEEGSVKLLLRSFVK
jgi:hypothetical protein